MMRGLFYGFLGGGCIGLLCAAAVSLVSPLPARVELQIEAADSVTQPDVKIAPGLAAPSAIDSPVNADSVAQAPVRVAPSEIVPEADVVSAPKPPPVEVSAVDSLPDVNDAGDIEVSDEEPVFPSPQANAIDVPTAQSENVTVSLRPIQRPVIETPETSNVSAPAVGESPAAPSTINVPIETTRAVSSQTEIVAAPATELNAENGEIDQASLLQPATDLDEAFPQLRSNRLPTVGSSQIAADASGIADDSPLVQFAAPYERINTRPILAVVLMDEGKSDLDLEILREFPFPVSVAVNASASNAKERARMFRSAGIEVLAMLDLPEGAKPEDVEVAMGSGLLELPETVAILEGEGIGLQESREVSDQVISYVKSSGHGLVMLPKGLNTAQKMAARDGVPSVTVFRDFDGKGQTEVVMRRFLDQAAFKARQEDGVLMLGRLRPDTLAALAIWSLADRASTVALAPASALLRNSQGEG